MPRSIPIIIVKKLLDFQFSGGDDLQVLALRQLRKFDLGGFPTFVPQNAAWGFAIGRDVADELIGSAVAGGFGVVAFDAIDHRFERDVSLESLAALTVDVADGGPDLVVRISGDIFHQKVDEAGVALQDREELQGSIGRLELRRCGCRLWSCDGLDIAAVAGDVFRYGTPTEQGKKRTKGGTDGQRGQSSISWVLTELFPLGAKTLG